MQNLDGSLAIVYNGEIYNTQELAAVLEGIGVHARSRCDTEIVLRLYEAFGAESVRMLDGMFAFAIWDSRNETLFIARDHFGIKPLYYAQTSSGFACASEVKALLKMPGVERDVDPASVGSFLNFLWVPDPDTMFLGIKKLEAGQCATIAHGVMNIEQYWDLEFPTASYGFGRSEADLVEEFRSLFGSSVRRQMVSDVPLGAFLSAGLDSSAIVAEMAAASSGPVQTFTVAFEGAVADSTMIFDDTEVAARTAAQFGCEHHEIRVKPDVVDLLPKLIWHLDEPIADPAVVPAYLVNREAKRHVTVLLSGVGGDELLGGYRKYIADRWSSHYRRIPNALRSRAIGPAVERLPSGLGTRWADPVRLAKKMVRSGSLARDDAFLMNSTYFDRAAIARLLKPERRESVLAHDAWRRHRSHLATVSDADDLNRCLYLDTKTFMTSLNLTYNDKMSMAVPTEVRVPFLDRRLAEFMASQVPPNMKLKGTLRPTTKHLLRKAMQGILPEEVFSQRKAGFGMPVSTWINGDLAPMINDLLSPRRVADRGWFEPREVANVLQAHRSGRDDRSLQIWALLTFELWHQQFIDPPSF